MFTGIVQGTYLVKEVKKKEGALSIVIEMPSALVSGLNKGASVSVDGVCLTVSDIKGSLISFDVIAETLRKTTLKRIQAGAKVNIERALKVGDEIGGHFLSGHIVCVGEIVDKKVLPGETILSVSIVKEWIKYFFPKGYAAIDGISLTIVDVDPNGLFTVHLIPETLKTTTLGFKDKNDQVNIEIDSQTLAIVETIERILKPK